MSDPRGLKTSHLAALGGAILALVSLWAPWYRVHLPAAIRDVLQHRAGAVPAPVGSFMQSLAALLPESVSGDGWQVFGRTDAVVAFVSATAIAALLAAAGGLGDGVRVDRSVAGRVATGAGLIAGVLVAGRIANPPGPNAYIDVRWGAWACLLGCAAMALGGMVSAMDRQKVAPGAASPVPAPPPAGSVAPPS